MTPDVIQLMRQHNMSADCNNCGKPVRAEKKYCDPFCTYEKLARNKAERESDNDTRN